MPLTISDIEEKNGFQLAALQDQYSTQNSLLSNI